MENPDETLLPLEERGRSPCQAKVHIPRGEEINVFELLRERGIIRWVKDSDVFVDSRGKYLSGMFGVVKPGRFTPCNQLILRVIMNLIPINSIFETIEGDIRSLPSSTSWLPVHITCGEQLEMSQGDMSSAFYLFSLPPAWSPFMCFNFSVKGSDLPQLNLEPNEVYRPSCAVFPMGWASSVGLMQMIQMIGREILLSKGLPRESKHACQPGLLRSWTLPPPRRRGGRSI